MYAWKRYICISFTWLESHPLLTDSNHFGTFGDLAAIIRCAKLPIDWSRDFVRQVPGA